MAGSEESQAATGGTAAPERGRAGEEGDVHVVAAGQRGDTLQEPEKHMGAHVDGTVGQREAEAEESDLGTNLEIHQRKLSE